MRTWGFTLILGALCVGLACAGAQADTADDNWPTWRGPTGNGVALKGAPPTTWSESENIKWKISLPGSGLSTPVVWGNKMFIQTAAPTAEEPPPPQAEEGDGERQGRRRRGRGMRQPTVPWAFNVVCIDRRNGEVLWEKTAVEAVPHEGHHPTNSFASYSPVTDGKLLWVSFGTRGLFCYDLDGKKIWSANLPELATRNGFGEGSSPGLAGDAIIVLADQQSGSKVLAFNKNTGAPLWEKERDEVTSWATPLAVEVDGKLQVIIPATKLTRSYDAKTGDLIWQCAGQTVNVIPSPVLGFGRVYCTSGYRGSSLQAIELGRTGDLTETDAIAWHVDEATPYVASPLLYDDKIYVTADLDAVISCYNAETGAPIFVEQELAGMEGVYASPVGAGGHVYVAGRGGTTTVLKHGEGFEVVAQNVLDDNFDASPVVIGDELYLKGIENLYCIAK